VFYKIEDLYDSGILEAIEKFKIKRVSNQKDKEPVRVGHMPLQHKTCNSFLQAQIILLNMRILFKYVFNAFIRHQISSSNELYFFKIGVCGINNVIIAIW